MLALPGWTIGSVRIPFKEAILWGSGRRTGPTRLIVLPSVPTFQEEGVADMDVSSWWGLVGPVGSGLNVARVLQLA